MEILVDLLSRRFCHPWSGFQLCKIRLADCRQGAEMPQEGACARFPNPFNFGQGGGQGVLFRVWR